MTEINAYNIFVPGGMPHLTYIERQDKKLVERVRRSKSNLCKIVTVTGQTKSGKTVLVKNEFPTTDRNNIWIDAGTITNENDIWDKIIDRADGWTARESSSVDGSSTSVGGRASGTVSALVAKGTGEISLSNTDSMQSSEKRTRSISSKSIAAEIITERKYNIIIDDFHYLDKAIQSSFVRAVKQLVFNGVCVILIAIPHKRYDAINVEKEMTGRVENISVPVWSDDELIKIPEMGFRLLNINIDSSVTGRLTRESIGSPHLMQELCRELCDENDIFDKKDRIMDIISLNLGLFKNVADSYGKLIFEKLAKGPRQRSDRIQRTLKNGDSVDIYKVVLLALSNMKPGIQAIEYEEIRSYIKDLVTDSVPQAHEVSRVMEKMAQIASQEKNDVPVLDWDKEDRKLHITDPFFAFYLRWR